MVRGPVRFVLGLYVMALRGRVRSGGQEHVSHAYGEAASACWACQYHSLSITTTKEMDG